MYGPGDCRKLAKSCLQGSATLSTTCPTHRATVIPTKKATPWIISLPCIGPLVLLAVLTLALIACGVQEELSDSLANDDGRAFMLSQSCIEVMAEYTAMLIGGRDAAVMHVANTYNIKTGTNSYIAISDAQVRIDQCSNRSTTSSSSSSSSSYTPPQATQLSLPTSTWSPTPTPLPTPTPTPNPFPAELTAGVDALVHCVGRTAEYWLEHGPPRLEADLVACLNSYLEER